LRFEFDGILLRLPFLGRGGKTLSLPPKTGSTGLVAELGCSGMESDKLKLGLDVVQPLFACLRSEEGLAGRDARGFFGGR